MISSFLSVLCGNNYGPMFGSVEQCCGKLKLYLLLNFVIDTLIINISFCDPLFTNLDLKALHNHMGESKLTKK